MTRAHRVAETITPRAQGLETGTGDRFLIVVEGEETERRYFDDLCGKLHFTVSKVIIKHPDSDPLNMVEAAIRLRDIERRRDEEGQAAAFNQVWVVCDRETRRMATHVPMWTS